MTEVEVETFVKITITAKYAWALTEEIEKIAKESPDENKGIQNIIKFREALMAKIAPDKET